MSLFLITEHRKMNLSLLKCSYIKKEGGAQLFRSSVFSQLVSLAFAKCAQKQNHFGSRGNKQHMGIIFFFRLSQIAKMPQKTKEKHYPQIRLIFYLAAPKFCRSHNYIQVAEAISWGCWHFDFHPMCFPLFRRNTQGLSRQGGEQAINHDYLCWEIVQTVPGM